MRPGTCQYPQISQFEIAVKLLLIVDVIFTSGRGSTQAGSAQQEVTELSSY